MIRGQRALAKELGVAVSTANKYVNDPQWKLSGLLRSGPWSKADIERAREFQARFYSPAGAPELDDAGCDGDPLTVIRDLSPERQAKLRLAIERTLSIRFDRELKSGKYELREAVERRSLQKVQAVRGALGNIRSLSPRLVGKDMAEMELILEAWAMIICNRFAAAED